MVSSMILLFVTTTNFLLNNIKADFKYGAELLYDAFDDA